MLVNLYTTTYVSQSEFILNKWKRCNQCVYYVVSCQWYLSDYDKYDSAKVPSYDKHFHCLICFLYAHQ